jgi:hypothetical protein
MEPNFFKSLFRKQGCREIARGFGNDCIPNPGIPASAAKRAETKAGCGGLKRHPATLAGEANILIIIRSCAG